MIESLCGRGCARVKEEGGGGDNQATTRRVDRAAKQHGGPPTEVRIIDWVANTSVMEERISGFCGVVESLCGCGCDLQSTGSRVLWVRSCIEGLGKPRNLYM